LRRGSSPPLHCTAPPLPPPLLCIAQPLIPSSTSSTSFTPATTPSPCGRPTTKFVGLDALHVAILVALIELAQPVAGSPPLRCGGGLARASSGLRLLMGMDGEEGI
jgi:hypothetical protein